MKHAPSVLWEDETLVVLNKPAGIVVNRAESVKGETVQEWVALRFKSQITNPNFQKNIDPSHWSLKFGHCDFCSRAGIVHRIDKETSGILLVAKTPESFVNLQQQFQAHEVKKTYLALVHGDVPKEGKISAPVGRLPWNRGHFGIVPGGKEAVTKYKRRMMYEVRSMKNIKKISLVEVYPETGRTHQIRVHFKYLGYPLVGDYLYGGRIQSRDDRMWAPRVMLHAWKIEFRHPTTSVPLAFEAPIPDDMQGIIKSQNTSTKLQTNSNF
jgi:23S rRNA pseudouridine1911/1915/1917 synthase